METATPKRRVVIVGGGFGGLTAAKKLISSERFDITLIDRRNHHIFQPLLYQVAMAQLSPADIAVPIRSILRAREDLRVLLDEVSGVNLKERTIQLNEQELEYDTLILACGARHSYFGHEEWEEFAPGLKTIEQATEIRRRALLAFEQAEQITDKAKRERLLRFVVVGGGPTGAELAGALAEMCKGFTGSTEFPHICATDWEVYLIEGSSRILEAFSPQLSEQAKRDLEQMGVRVLVGRYVTKIDSAGVWIGEQLIETSSAIWAAGVKPSEVNLTLGVPLDRVGRVIVEKDLSIPGYPDVFVIGDQACFLTEGGKALPGISPVAIQQGRFVAQHLIDEADRKTPRQEFRYFDKGQMATLGRSKAIAEYKSVRFHGFFAWLLWLGVHIFFLIGFRNRLVVMLSWGWAYIIYKRTARLILEKEWRMSPPAERAPQRRINAQ